MFKICYNNVNNIFRGADDLLPILVYVVLKAEVPNVHAEVNCLLDFIEEKTMSKPNSF